MLFSTASLGGVEAHGSWGWGGFQLGASFLRRPSLQRGNVRARLLAHAQPCQEGRPVRIPRRSLIAVQLAKLKELPSLAVVAGAPLGRRQLVQVAEDDDVNAAEGKDVVPGQLQVPADLLQHLGGDETDLVDQQNVHASPESLHVLQVHA